MKLPKFSKFWIVLALLVTLVGCKAQSKEELLQEGLKLSGQGNWTGAVVCYRNALEKDAAFFEARYQLAIAYLKLGRFDQAEKEFEKVGRQNPSLPEMPLHLAELYLSSDRPEKAQAEAEGYLASHPENAQGLDLLGRSRALQGDMVSARRHFEAALRVDPRNHSAQTNLAQAFLESGDEEGAQGLLRRLAQDDPKNRSAMYLLARLEAGRGDREEAHGLYRRLVESDRKDPQALYMAGLMALGLGKTEEVEKDVADLSSRFSGNPLAAQLRGLLAYQKQDFDEAVVQLQRAIKIRPDLTAYYFLGLSYYQAGNLELALNQLQKVLDHNPESAQTRNMVAMTLLRQKRLDDAVREAQMALRHDPKNALARNILGSAYMAQGNFDRAMEEFDRATALDPNLADAHLKKGLFNLSRGKFAQGEEEMVRAMTIAPEVLDTRLVLATHYLRRQNFAAAVETLEGGLQGRSEDAVLYNVMAGAFFSQNQPQKGLEALLSAKKADPDYFTPYFNLASVYQGRGEADKARAEIDAVLSRDPDNVRALVAAGNFAEIRGSEREALSFYERAMATKEIDGFLAMILFQGKKGESARILTLVEEALNSHADHPTLLEIQGQALLRSGRLPEAAPVFETLEKASPGRGFPMLVRIWLQQNERGKAEAVARRAIQDDSRSAYGYLLQAAIHEATGEPNKAMEVLEGARARVKNDPRLEMQIGALHERAGETRRAMETYRALTRAAPDFLPAVFALGAAHDGSGDKKEALRLYQQVLQGDKNFTPALNNLAYLYAKNYGNPEEGLRLAMQAYRNEPGRPEIMDTLGYLLVRNGRAAEAVPVLERAAGMLPRVPTVLYHLALAYQGVGDSAKAAEALRRALAVGDFPEKAESRTLLAQMEK